MIDLDFLTRDCETRDTRHYVVSRLEVYCLVSIYNKTGGARDEKICSKVEATS